MESTPLTSSPLSSVRTLPRDAAGLNVFRLLGAIHVTTFHYIHDGCTFCHWGMTWVSFFFMLSGFGSTHSRLSRTPISKFAFANPGPVLPRALTLFRRVVGVWPAYALAIGATLLFYLRKPPPAFLPTPVSGPLLAIELGMVQEWLPTGAWRDLLPLANRTRVDVEYSRFYNEINIEDWFVSVLAFYWLIENSLFELFALVCRQGTPTAFPLNGVGAAFTGLLSWVVYVVWIGSDQIWPTLTSLEVPRTLTFAHHYAAGVWLAFFLHQRTHRPPMLFGFASCVATASLVGIFFVPLGHDAISDWARDIGLLLPLWALLIAGMVEGDRVLCWLLDRWPLTAISTELAYPTYILQKPARMLAAVLRCDDRGGGMNCSMTTSPLNEWLVTIGILLPVAALVAVGVTRPIVATAKWLLPATMGSGLPKSGSSRGSLESGSSRSDLSAPSASGLIRLPKAAGSKDTEAKLLAALGGKV